MAEGQLKDRNRRASPRKVIRQSASMACGETILTVQTFDVGRDGMCLVSHRPVAPGTRCKITFDVPLPEAPITVTASLKVVYSSYVAAGEFKIGAVFTELDDAAALVIGKFASEA
jgi:hypothetical protein